MALPKYDLRHEAGGGRCVWCWRELDPDTQHAAVEPRRRPGFDGRPLRFHLECWPVYLAVAGPGADTGRHWRSRAEWTPERIERLRIHTGRTFPEFARLCHIGDDRLSRIMAGLESVNDRTADLFVTVANAHRFERTTALDWSDPDVVFSLCASQKWSVPELGRRIGVGPQAASRYARRGVPVTSVRAWNRLGLLALEVGFTAADVVTPAPWTAELFRAAVDSSGETLSAWARAMRASYPAANAWYNGRIPISRDGCWRITREAMRRGLPSPEGVVRRRISRPPAAAQSPTDYTRLRRGRPRGRRG